MFVLCCLFCFLCVEYGHLSSSCTKAANASKSNAHRDWLDGSSLTTDVAESQVECDLMHLSSCSGDGFSVKGGDNGVKGHLKSSLNELLGWHFRCSRFCAWHDKAWLQVTTCWVPHSVFLKNNRSALQHPEFLAEAISKLLSNGCITGHEVPPFWVNPLTVAEAKKLRLVIDLRHVNNYLFKPKFKYKDFCSLSQVLDEGHWFFTWDLKSGYHHVDICLDHQFCLAFFWRCQIFSFTVLSFGLSSAYFCFTKLMHPLVECWHSMGHNSFIYLDDSFGSWQDKCSATTASIIQRK